MNLISKTLVALALALVAAIPVKADVYTIAVTNFHVEGTEKLGSTLGQLATKVLKPGDRVIVLDGAERKKIADFLIPEENRFNSPKIRFKQVKKQFRPIAVHQTKRKADPSSGDTNDLLSFYRFFGDSIRASYPKEPVHMILFGSPIQHDPRQPGFSMRGAVFPNDGHFTVDGYTSPYGVADRQSHFNNSKLHFCVANEDLQSLEYEERVERAWSLYIAGLGGTLATFTRDTNTCVQRFLDKSDPQREFLLNPEQKRPVMIKLVPSGQSKESSQSPEANSAQPQKRLSANQAGRFLGTDIPVNSTPALNKVGRLKVGIRWDCNCDLDLYVRHKSETKPLYFNNKKSKLGSFFKDWTSSTKDALSYEFIEFHEPVDAQDLEIKVNFYSGKVRGGPKGAVRIWLDGHDGVWEMPFHIPASSGSKGQNRNTANSPHWVHINPLQVLRLSSAQSQ